MTSLLWLFGLLSYSSDNGGDMRLAFEFFFKHFVFNSSDTVLNTVSHFQAFFHDSQENMFCVFKI